MELVAFLLFNFVSNLVFLVIGLSVAKRGYSSDIVVDNVKEIKSRFSGGLKAKSNKNKVVGGVKAPSKEELEYRGSKMEETDKVVSNLFSKLMGKK